MTSDYLQENTSRDPTWRAAHEIVQKQLAVPTQLWRLIRTAWQGQLDSKEFIKLLGFSRINPVCLVQAAEIDTAGKAPTVEQLEQALQVLGIRYSAVVLAINFSCRAALQKKPPSTWRSIFEEMMVNVEIGYKLGGKAFDLGIEGGVLVGFANHCGIAVLLRHDPKTTKNYYLALKQMKEGAPADRKNEISLFGCEPYQVASLAMQQLGFGLEVALGVALGTGQLNPAFLEFDQGIARWKAAALWIHALRTGRSYPAEVDMRNYFSEITPPAPGATNQNVVLQALYTEVSKVKSQGSRWLWHLPRPSYEATMEFVEAK